MAESKRVWRTQLPERGSLQGGTPFVVALVICKYPCVGVEARAQIWVRENAKFPLRDIGILYSKGWVGYNFTLMATIRSCLASTTLCCVIWMYNTLTKL